MRTRVAIVAVGLVGAACGGNWSNKDLEFLNALPTRQDLESSVPGDTAAQPLSAAGSGVGTRRDELGVGTRSEMHQRAVTASREFNQGVDSLLALVEAVRRFPPTRREGDLRRIWGPFPSRENPGFEARLVMERTSEKEFVYRVEFSREGAGEWFDVANGSFLASSGIRKGVGAFTISATQGRAGGLTDPALERFNLIDVAYDTSSSSKYVHLRIEATPQAVDLALDYEYLGGEDGGGNVKFLFTGPVCPEADLARPEELRIRAAWRPSGEGRVEAEILAGDCLGAKHHECWDEQFRTTWYTTWDSGAAGTESASCSELRALLKL